MPELTTRNLVPMSNVSPEVHRAFMTGQFDQSQWKTLRNRVEDQLRKNPAALRKVVALLASEETIRFSDILQEEAIQ